MPLVRFDQDPELQPGAGLFHADDGSSFFAHDPEMAAQLSPQPDERLARNSAGADIDALSRELAGGQMQPVAPPTATDAAPAGSDAGRIQQALYRSEAAPPPQAAPPEPQSPALGQAEQLQSNIDAYAMRPVYEAPRKGGVLPTTQQETRETSGMPYSEADAAVRADASINKNMAYSGQQNAQAARAAGDAAAYQAALPELQEQARIAQMKRDMQDRQYRRDRDDLEKAIEESDKSSKSFNANRWFEERGAVGQIGAAIAQAFGAGAATLSGGPNMVLNQINGYIDRDIANQRQQIEAGKENANSALARLNRQFGNLDQAEAALRIAQQKKVETMASAYAASTKNEDIQKALDVWLAEGNEKRVATEQQFMNAAYGKTSVTTAAKVVTPTAGGMRAPNEAEVQKRYDTLGKRGNVVGGTYENEIKRQKAEGMDPEKAEKARGLVIEDLQGNQVTARSEPEATKIREMKSLHTNASGALGNLKGLAKSGSSLSPDDLRSVDLNIEAVVNGANTIAGQNAVKGEDMDRYKKALKNAVGSMPAEKALNELQGILDRSYQARVDAQRGSAVKEAQTDKGSQVKYTGKAAKNPTAAGQFRQVGK